MYLCKHFLNREIFHILNLVLSSFSNFFSHLKTYYYLTMISSTTSKVLRFSTLMAISTTFIYNYLQYQELR